ncbi:hypothetical protein HOG48_00605 [Candidatus Peregrinibacteria bacterium]|jgi:uncharacterized protein YjeT (DUF2065 family)|nr:hypothetical protein [Candidatus Peregrinibacteria bacterium]
MPIFFRILIVIIGVVFILQGVNPELFTDDKKKIANMKKLSLVYILAGIILVLCGLWVIFLLA